MKKELRQQVFNKYNGKCAYSGTELKEDWQIDHLIPLLSYHIWGLAPEIRESRYEITWGKNDIENLMPVQKIVNHYKRSLSLKDFREWYLGNLHLRLRKLPKNSKSLKAIEKKKYLLEVASLFGITEYKPFSGLFYFETITK